MSEDINNKIRAYLEKNPDTTNKEIVEIFNVNINVANGVRQRFVRARIIKEYKAQQEVNTPEGYKGSLVRGKMWQVYDGSWRESLQFDVNFEEQWGEFKKKFLDELSLLGSLQTVNNKVVESGDVCLEISLPDLHFGKGNIEELSTRFLECVFNLLEKAERFGVERILLPVGNDGMNSEGKRKTTTGGTPQEDTVDWQSSFRHYWTTITALVQVLSSTYKVDVIVVPGNHDMERMFYAGEVLAAYFKGNKNVSVNNSGEYRKYFEYGVNMLMFTHGDKEKTANLPLIMATEQPEMFARTKYREAHLGHFHKEMLNEFCGIKTRFLPSICITDDWHKMMGYSHMKAAQAYLWNKEKGLEGYFQVNIFD
jgi:hypothetical protein